MSHQIHSSTYFRYTIMSSQALKHVADHLYLSNIQTSHSQSRSDFLYRRWFVIYCNAFSISFLNGLRFPWCLWTKAIHEKRKYVCSLFQNKMLHIMRKCASWKMLQFASFISSAPSDLIFLYGMTDLKAPCHLSHFNKVQWQWEYLLLATRFAAYPWCRWAHLTKRWAFYVD